MSLFPSIMWCLFIGRKVGLLSRKISVKNKLRIENKNKKRKKKVEKMSVDLLSFPSYGALVVG
jgi:hypothetical protein